MKHWIIPFLIILVGGLAGCTQNTTVNSTSDSKGVMAQRQTLDLATGNPLTTLDTDKMDQFGRLNNTIEGLYQTNRDGQAQLALAQRVKVNAAKTTYTFTLWKDSYWSNGDLITAQNFVYAWRRALDPRTKAPDADLFRGIQNAKQILAGQLPADQLGVQAQGKFKLIVHLDHPMAELPQRLAYPLFGPQNQRIAKKFGKKYATKPEYQVYAGPFMVSSHGDTRQHWHMVPNPHYWDRKHVYLTRINVNVYRSQAKAWHDYRAGKLDEVRLLTKKSVKAYEYKNSYTARPYSRMILLNYRRNGPNVHHNQLLAQSQARLAISHAINRKTLGRNTYGSASLPAQGIVPAGLSRGLRGTADFAASQPHQKTLKYQPKVAQREWRAALKRAGLTHVTLTLSYLDATNSQSLAKQLIKQLTQTLPGLTIKPQARVWQLTTDRSAPLTSDLNLTTQRAQYADPLSMLSLYTSTSTANTGHWRNFTYDDLVAQASTAPAFNTHRWKTLLKADGILMQQQGVTPLFQPASTYLINPHLNGVQFNTVGTQSNFKEAYFVK
ncbi:peptide ABC transporter substrate-binding protein [Levilactobacillus acidifarinae]|uniref:ABC-type oligopeptide transport system, periplasmic component n=1 Tax=Levilactobacillus acidifarinae DSM 19394 = JCM 15949 TaxID=1423715 RepID=A0A0R1LE50_9LACO|nr:peptide ABC transporter substrate-binding protein [Levilactobacillus acidifarinae]KRK94075.1 ABC-type oligopeptide transport system, periplasmic component [Levilactobacillus acidifarinae DSM 19394]GEO69757.1 peptide ABC transporter substrate-binding protein [Levilactobacillus acidifarinae]